MADAIGEAAEKTLVAPVLTMRHMGEYPAHHLYCVAGLDDVRVVKYENGREAAFLEIAPNGYLRPQLTIDIVHYLAPFCPTVVKEIIEDVLVAAHKFEKWRVHIVGRVGDGEHGEHQQQLEDAQCRVKAIGLRLLKTKWAQIKFYILQHKRNCSDCTVSVIFSEKRGDFRENFCNFAYGLKCFVCFIYRYKDTNNFCKNRNFKPLFLQIL